jgi:hypothetical protein
VRQLAEADAEYYSVLKDEFKNKTPTPPSKETEQSIFFYKTLNERINQLEIAISQFYYL